MLGRAYKSKLSVQHEHYNPSKEKRDQKFKYLKKIVMTAFYLAALAIVINFAESNRVALAKPIPEVKKAPLQSRAQIIEDYYTKVTGSREIAQYAIQSSRLNQVPVSLLVSLMKVESNFNPRAINHNKNGSIDRGLCQLNNRTFKELKLKDFFDPETNIAHACQFLNWCLEESNYNLVIALAYYNAGYGNVYNEKVGGTTLNYINKIQAHMRKHEEKLADLFLKNQ